MTRASTAPTWRDCHCKPVHKDRGWICQRFGSGEGPGVAPDAQLITMKVFGKNGGAYDSDYMAAIEDAILLGCDVVNLSLGSSNPGNT